MAWPVARFRAGGRPTPLKGRRSGSAVSVTCRCNGKPDAGRGIIDLLPAKSQKPNNGAAFSKFNSPVAGTFFTVERNNGQANEDQMTISVAQRAARSRQKIIGLHSRIRELSERIRALTREAKSGNETAFKAGAARGSRMTLEKIYSAVDDATATWLSQILGGRKMRGAPPSAERDIAALAEKFRLPRCTQWLVADMRRVDHDQTRGQE